VLTESPLAASLLALEKFFWFGTELPGSMTSLFFLEEG
jgi:hypothetical protein